MENRSEVKRGVCTRVGGGGCHSHPLTPDNTVCSGFLGSGRGSCSFCHSPAQLPPPHRAHRRWRCGVGTAPGSRATRVLASSGPPCGLGLAGLQASSVCRHWCHPRLVSTGASGILGSGLPEDETLPNHTGGGGTGEGPSPGGARDQRRPAPPTAPPEAGPALPEAGVKDRGASTEAGGGAGPAVRGPG